MHTRLCSLLIAAFLLAVSDEARAQTAQWPWSAPATGQAEIDRRARWEAYYRWRSEVWNYANRSIDPRRYIDKYKKQIVLAGADRAPSDDRESNRTEGVWANLGLFDYCFATFTGLWAPRHAGICPSVRIHINRWAVNIDPVFVWVGAKNLEPDLFGFRPGVQYSLWHGVGAREKSDVFVQAGFDVWIPVNAASVSPSVFLGGFAGLGAVIFGPNKSGARLGIGASMRLIVRGGVGNQDQPGVKDVSAFQIGYELHGPGVYLSFE